MNTREFHGEVQKGVFVLPASQAMQRENYLRSFKDGSLMVEKIGKATRPKTWSQCKIIFGLAFRVILDSFEEWGWGSDVLLNIDRPTGVPINSDMLKFYFYSMFPTYREDKRITLSSMDTVEASLLYENIKNWSASQWKIVVPESGLDDKPKG